MDTTTHIPTPVSYSGCAFTDSKAAGFPTPSAIFPGTAASADAHDGDVYPGSLPSQAGHVSASAFSSKLGAWYFPAIGHTVYTLHHAVIALLAAGIGSPSVQLSGTAPESSIQTLQTRRHNHKLPNWPEAW
ncbi:hypothetical protein MFIFM68171_03999 [Madurella fahalii]|uniref:Uncharacterized protein n=1 Tax=Madurella fahalii TaxID=1157608 RepID=A0ABQ0G7Q9_9PEZI